MKRFILGGWCQSLIDKVLGFNLGGLFIWKYDVLTDEHYKLIKLTL